MKRQKLTYVNTLLASFAILLAGLVYADGLEADRHIQDSRQTRIEETAYADLVNCSRGNYQDARDKLQDQLLLDLVTGTLPARREDGRPQVERPRALDERRALFVAAINQLEQRLEKQPPSVPALLERWRGNPVSERIEHERERDAAGSVARAEARDRDDRIELPVNCDKLASQRPFTR
jgi:hypothetical protein